MYNSSLSTVGNERLLLLTIFYMLKLYWMLSDF